MQLQQTQYGELTVIQPQMDRLDAAIAVRFKDVMREVADSGADHVLLDMSQITFMDSSGLGAVVAVMKHMGREKLFELAHLTTAVDKVFKLTQMDRVFQIYATVQDALGACERSQAG
jgi:anti-sigma B factor antagonist